MSNPDTFCTVHRVWYGRACPDCITDAETFGPLANQLANQEADPTGRDPHQPGAKLDAGKSPVRRGLLEYFPRACLAVAEVSAVGAEKYTWGGWQSVPDGINRYGDAEARHICKAAIDGPVDPDYGLTHAAHEAWNAMARLELLLREKEANPP